MWLKWGADWEAIDPLIKNLHLAIDRDRDRDPHWSTGPSSQGPMKSSRRENKEVRTVRGASTHGDGGTDLMRARMGLTEHVIKSNSLNVADNEGGLRSQ